MLSFILFVGIYWYLWYCVSNLLQTKGKNKLISHTCGGLFGLFIASTLFTDESEENVEPIPPQALSVVSPTVYTTTSVQSLIQENPTQAYLSNSFATPLPKAETAKDEVHITLRSSYSPQHLEKINKEQVISRLAMPASEKAKEKAKSKRNTHAIKKQKQRDE